MGGCASKPKVLKADKLEAAPPPPEEKTAVVAGEEKVEKEVEEEVAKAEGGENVGDEEKEVEVVEQEVEDIKPRSLGNLFKEYLQSEEVKESTEAEEASMKEEEDAKEIHEVTAPSEPKEETPLETKGTEAKKPECKTEPQPEVVVVQEAEISEKPSAEIQIPTEEVEAAAVEVHKVTEAPSEPKPELPETKLVEREMHEGIAVTEREVVEVLEAEILDVPTEEKEEIGTVEVTEVAASSSEPPKVELPETVATDEGKSTSTKPKDEVVEAQEAEKLEMPTKTEKQDDFGEPKPEIIKVEDNKNLKVPIEKEEAVTVKVTTSSEPPKVELPETVPIDEGNSTSTKSKDEVVEVQEAEKLIIPIKVEKPDDFSEPKPEIIQVEDNKSLEMTIEKGESVAVKMTTSSEPPKVDVPETLPSREEKPEDKNEAQAEIIVVQETVSIVELPESKIEMQAPEVVVVEEVSVPIVAKEEEVISKEVIEPIVTKEEVVISKEVIDPIVAKGEEVISKEVIESGEKLVTAVKFPTSSSVDVVAEEVENK